MLAAEVGPLWLLSLSDSLDVQARGGTCLGEFRKLFVVRSTELHKEPTAPCFRATNQRQIQTCSAGDVHAVVSHSSVRRLGSEYG